MPNTNQLHPVYHGHTAQPGSRIDIDRVLPADISRADMDEWIEKLSEPPRYVERISPVSTVINTDMIRGKNWTDMMMKCQRVFLRMFGTVSFYLRQALAEKFGERAMVPFTSLDIDPDTLNRIVELDYEQGENTYGQLMELFRTGIISPAATTPFHAIVPLFDTAFDRRLAIRIGLLLYWDIVKEYQATIKDNHGEAAFVMPFWFPECGCSMECLVMLHQEFMALAKRDRIADPHLVVMLDNQQSVGRDLDVLMKSWNKIRVGEKPGDTVHVIFRDRAFSDWVTYAAPSVKKLIDRTIAKVDSDLNDAGVDYGWGHFEEVESITANARNAQNFEQKIVKLAQLSYMSVSTDFYIRRKMNGKFANASHEPQETCIRDNGSWLDWHATPTLGRWQGILDSNAPFKLVDEHRPYTRRARTGKLTEPGPQTWKLAYSEARRRLCRAVQGDPDTMQGGAVGVLAALVGAKDAKIVRRNVTEFLVHFAQVHWREHFLQHDLSEADCEVRELVDLHLMKDIKRKPKDAEYLTAAVAAQGYYFALDSHRSYATAHENMDQRAMFQSVTMLVLSAANLATVHHWRGDAAPAKALVETIRAELFDFPSAYTRYKLSDYGVTPAEWAESIKSGIEESPMNVVERAARRACARHLRPLGYKKEFPREDEAITTNVSHAWAAEVENTNYKWENKMFCGLREE